jgi:hypothetical protein
MSKLLILITILCLVAMPLQANAAKKAQSDKEKLVLMPLRLTEDIQNMQGAIETSLAEGLHDNYTVFSGAEVKEKSALIFKKATAIQKCDETRCLQDIAMAFQSELVAVANITKTGGGYLLSLSIRNVYDNQSVYDKSIPCKGCDEFQVVDRLKELGRGGADTANLIPQIQTSPNVLKFTELQMVPIPGKYYELGKYDVTQKEWLEIMGNNPSRFNRCGDNCPVENVSWYDVQEFIQKLNVMTGRQYRLPTEEEWEYACYAGNKTEYCGGNDLNLVAWYNENSNKTTHPVGQKQSNGFGLFDMSGNVWQLMQNTYDSEHDWVSIRGGSWYDIANDLRAFYRPSGYLPKIRFYLMGFRLARTIPAG